jgi:hypothetical protein
MQRRHKEGGGNTRGDAATWRCQCLVASVGLQLRSCRCVAAGVALPVFGRWCVAATVWLQLCSCRSVAAGV